MSWTFLIFAGVLEVAFAYCLKASGNFTRPWPVIGFVIGAAVSLYCLSRAMQTIPLGTAYAVWTGIGAVGTAILGVVTYGEPLSFGRIFFMATLVFSIVGLKFFGGEA